MMQEGRVVKGLRTYSTRRPFAGAAVSQRELWEATGGGSSLP